MTRADTANSMNTTPPSSVTGMETQRVTSLALLHSAREVRDSRTLFGRVGRTNIVFTMIVTVLSSQHSNRILSANCDCSHPNTGTEYLQRTDAYTLECMTVTDLMKHTQLQGRKSVYCQSSLTTKRECCQR